MGSTVGNTLYNSFLATKDVNGIPLSETMPVEQLYAKKKEYERQGKVFAEIVSGTYEAPDLKNQKQYDKFLQQQPQWKWPLMIWQPLSIIAEMGGKNNVCS